ncbi:hypothetical protein [Halorussus litoreus]|uniref:hypothetical protein n=1 Tax=Halorussus litoreus TaxID=1710536 RepID=UPI000E2807D1|nr:hypothetical protein [Halorussus litoreus]
MARQATAVVDANVLLNLATPVVDGRPKAPSGGDPFRAFLSTYDVHTPEYVLGEVSDALGSDDLLSAAAEAVVKASHHLTVHEVESGLDEPLEDGLDEGESRAIRLTNDLDADLFVTDEFNNTNYLFVGIALDDRNVQFTTPHVLCELAEHDVLDRNYIDAALTYYVETKGWDEQYVELLRREFFAP